MSRDYNPESPFNNGPELEVAIPETQLQEIIDVLGCLAYGRENANTQAQAGILANAISNRMRDKKSGKNAPPLGVQDRRRQQR